MKKNIAIVILIGVLSWIPIVSQAQRHDDDSDNSSVKIIKGMVGSNDQDKAYDFVTFGLDAPDSYKVSYVEILDGKSRTCFATVYGLDGHLSHGISWYRIDLNEFKTPKTFTLVIHVVKDTGSDSGGSTIALRSLSTVVSPIVPDETILIVKYP